MSSKGCYGDSGFDSSSDNVRQHSNLPQQLESSPNNLRHQSNFVRKPDVGWLHPDKKILSDGICYGVRYIGCLEVNASMKELDYPTRSLVAVECINRVCEEAGLKTVDRRRKVDKKVRGLLADKPKMDHAGWNVTLKITSSNLQLISLDTGKPLVTHDMPNISFASAGDADTLDFVAYVAKQNYNTGRACFVLECGTGLAQDVITTIGQAFELRFEEYLKRLPGMQGNNTSAIANNNNTISSVNGNTQAERRKMEEEKRRMAMDDPEYYNDLPGKMPPEPGLVPPVSASLPPSACYPKTAGFGPRAASSQSDLIDLNSEPSTPLTAAEIMFRSDVHQYVNDPSLPPTPWSPPPTAGAPKDPFDMQPFTPSVATGGASSRKEQLAKEPWFHGPISRKDAEALVCQDGEFLVRESVLSPGQYVLTGMQNDQRKHLLLVDPEGVVRTKDRTFESVSHLINHHTLQRLPIISAESALLLKTPVPRKH